MAFLDAAGAMRGALKAASPRCSLLLRSPRPVGHSAAPPLLGAARRDST